MKSRLLLLSTFVIPFSIVFYFLLQNLGVFKKLYEKNVDKCIYEYSNIDQPEHVQVYKNILFMSSADRNKIVSKFWNLNETEYNALDFESAGIYALYPPLNNLEQDIKQKRPEKIELINYPSNQKFIPLAFSFYEDLMFVINTSYDGDKVDIFDVISAIDTQKVKLSYKRSLLFGKNFSKCLNSILVLNNEEFLVTKFSPLGHFEKYSTLKTIVSQLTQQNVTYTLYCKIGQSNLKCDIQHDTASTFNNGIIKDDQNRIYISHSIQERVSVYELKEYTVEDDSRKQLVWLRDIKVPGGPDNLNYDPEKQLIYVAMVGRFYDFFKAIFCLSLNDWKIPDQEDLNFWSSAGQITVTENVNEMEFYELFTINNKIRGISGMERIGKHFFLGSFLDNKLLVCKE